MNEKGLTISKKARVEKSRNPLLSAASSSVPEDWALDALRTGQLAFVKMTNDWERARIDRLLGRGEHASQRVADRIAQNFATGLERYLCSCPPQCRLLLAGEVMRGMLYEWMSFDTDWDPKDLDPMTKHGILARGSSGPRHAANHIRRLLKPDQEAKRVRDSDADGQ